MYYTHHPEYQALYRLVLENPLDDNVRLVLADWIEEKGGDTPRANLIRVQCALAQVSYEGCCDAVGNTLVVQRLDGKITGVKPCDCARGVLQYQSHRILCDASSPCEANVLNWCPDSLWRAIGLGVRKPAILLPTEYLFRRGFINEINVSPLTWLNYHREWYWHPDQKLPEHLSRWELEQYACKVCGNHPDRDGELIHGRGCYTQSSNGGGSEWITLPSGSVPPSPPPDAMPLTIVTLAFEQFYFRTTMGNLIFDGDDWGITRFDAKLSEITSSYWPTVKFRVHVALQPYLTRR